MLKNFQLTRKLPAIRDSIVHLFDGLSTQINCLLTIVVVLDGLKMVGSLTGLVFTELLYLDATTTRPIVQDTCTTIVSTSLL